MTTDLAARLAARADRMWQRFDETGDTKWLDAADKCEAARLRLMART